MVRTSLLPVHAPVPVWLLREITTLGLASMQQHCQQYCCCKGGSPRVAEPSVQLQLSLRQIPGILLNTLQGTHCKSRELKPQNIAFICWGKKKKKVNGHGFFFNSSHTEIQFIWRTTRSQRQPSPGERAAGCPAPSCSSSELPGASPAPAGLGLEGSPPAKTVGAVWWGGHGAAPWPPTTALGNDSCGPQEL